MKSQEADYTNTFRALSNVDKVGAEDFLAQFAETSPAIAWFDNYEKRLERESSEVGLRCLTMRATNPKYILRNYMAQHAIDMANQGDYSEVKRLRLLLEAPFSDESGLEKDTHPAPDWAQGLALSCSS